MEFAPEDAAEFQLENLPSLLRRVDVRARVHIAAVQYMQSRENYNVVVEVE